MPPPSDSHRNTVPPSPQSLAGKKVLVMGLGRFGGGVGVSRWLVQQGAIVTVNDASTAADLAESIHALDGLPITFRLGGHALEDFLAADLLIINPAVDKEKSDVVQAALKAGIPATTEINLFVQRCPALTIGVTGSVGKSTTTTLIYEAVRAGLGSAHDDTRVFLGGNIGRSLLLDLPQIRNKDIVILELSSFMLEDTPQVRWSPHIAVITNVFPNHLDRHNTMAAYSAAKKNIFKFQTPHDIAIFNDDHDLVSAWSTEARGRIIKFTTREKLFIPLLIPGEHNQSNAAAAMAVIDALDRPVNRQAALAAIQQFPGLSHRLALIHTIPLADGRPVRFYNDSKATSPDASITAINAFPARTALFLVGGYDKHINLAPFVNLLATRAMAIIGIGQTGESICNAVRAIIGSPNQIAYAETLDAALPLALKWAKESPTIQAIVLSPASASWGQFTNYEQRGDRFIQLSRALTS